MEFLVIFFPILIFAGLQDARSTAIAVAIVWAGRLVTAVGYWQGASKRVMGAWFHIPEFYCVYLAGLFAYSLISQVGTSI